MNGYAKWGSGFGVVGWEGWVVRYIVRGSKTQSIRMGKTEDAKQNIII